MKKFILLFTVLAAVSAVSCTRDEVRHSVASISDGELVTLKVGISAAQTRAGDDVSDYDEGKTTTPSTGSEANVNSLQVFVFSENGGLERSEYAENALSVELTCFAGHKDVVAVVNAPDVIDWGEIMTMGTLDSLITRLDENRLDNFFMYGWTEADVPEDEFINVEVSRRVARVLLRSVANEITSSSAVGSLCLNAAYLINVAEDAPYKGSEAPSNWYNQSRFDGYLEDENVVSPEFNLDDSPYVFLYEGLGSVPLSVDEPYGEEQVFYCYPNPTEQPTRLVVEATLNGRTWYYPITLDTVESNCSYEVELVITGAGAESPDSEPQIADFHFNITVADWELKDLKRVTI